MSIIRRSKIKRLIKQQKKSVFKRGAIISINLDAIPSFLEFDSKYWIRIIHQRGLILMDSNPEDCKVIKFKRRIL